MEHLEGQIRKNFTYAAAMIQAALHLPEQMDARGCKPKITTGNSNASARDWGIRTTNVRVLFERCAELEVVL